MSGRLEWMASKALGPSLRAFSFSRPHSAAQAALRLRPASDTACSDRPSISLVMPDSTLATTANSRPCCPPCCHHLGVEADHLGLARHGLDRGHDARQLFHQGFGLRLAHLVERRGGCVEGVEHTVGGFHQAGQRVFHARALALGQVQRCADLLRKRVDGGADALGAVVGLADDLGTGGIKMAWRVHQPCLAVSEQRKRAARGLQVQVAAACGQHSLQHHALRQHALACRQVDE